jgi:short-subunit dehydrogenase
MDQQDRTHHRGLAKTALITGASSGIGRELAKCFAADGHDLVLVARGKDELVALGQELSTTYGVTSTVISKDLFDPTAAREVYEQTRDAGIRIDYLVNDAGQGVYGKFFETDLEHELAIINLNISAMVVLTKLVLKDMVARNEGRILQLASIASTNPTPWSAVYSGTKAFIYYFSESLVEELKGTNVTVTALRPGATDTDFFRKEGALDARVVQEGKLADPAKVARDGYEALMKGSDAVVSGLKNKAMDKAAQLMPETAVAKQMGKMHEPVTQDRKTARR